MAIRRLRRRDDIKFSVSGVDIRKYGSQGQQRTAALTLKISEVNLLKEIIGEYPVLLLDDVFSEIDIHRKKRLLQYTKDIQTIVTATEFDEQLASRTNYKQFTVNNGKIF